MFPLTTIYQVNQVEGESPQRYAHRRWFISKQIPKTHTELLQAIKWSLVDASMIFDKCRYSTETEDLVKRMK